ncbi:D-sedoheptulose-7-phosphate isomerase [Microbacterium yannicii]|uniref:D-sedoheptulose-7-phosphate isomerase n=1 Tax=Microbacterium yannicii TaxID=671622 RepID=UPI0003113EB0|nr:SIS domain-containing protein [Microbacterium yannicii]
MSDWLDEQLDAHIATAREAAPLLPQVREVGAVLIDAFDRGSTLYTFGNGGSAADAQHFTGELIGHYKRDRRPLPAVTLTTDATVSTCIANDYAFEDVFSRQVEALARPRDVVAAFTTSGRSANVVNGLRAARANGATTLLFAGGDGGPSLDLADHAFLVPSRETPRIQELHTFLLHALSEILDAWAAGEQLR